MIFAQFLTRLGVMVYLCGLLIFASAVPAIAAATTSGPAKGAEPLPNIQLKAQKAVKADPFNKDKVIYESNQGLNEVQGGADFDKMKRGAGDSTLPAVHQAERALDKVGDKVNSVPGVRQAGNTLNKVGDKINSVKDDTLGKAGDTAKDLTDKAGDVINSLTGKAEDAVDSVKSGAKSLAGKAEDTVDSVKSGVKNDNLLDKAGDTAKDLTDKAGDVINSLTGKAEDAVDSVKSGAKSFGEDANELKDKANDSVNLRADEDFTKDRFAGNAYNLRDRAASEKVGNKVNSVRD